MLLAVVDMPESAILAEGGKILTLESGIVIALR